MLLSLDTIKAMFDWFVTKKLLFSVSEIESEINAQAAGIEWRANQVSGLAHKFADNGKYHTGEHGTRWCNVQLSEPLLAKIEESVGCRVYRKVLYLWDFCDKKYLPMHIDTEEINCGKTIACSIPLRGRFNLRMYRELSPETLVGECIYGPGELVLLNNRKYFHDGLVLDETRLGLHFFLDIENVDPNDSLPEILSKHHL